MLPSLQAGSTSRLPVSFTVQNAPAIVSGDLLTLTGLAAVTVVASHAHSNLVAGAFHSNTASSQAPRGTTITSLDVQKNTFTPNLALPACAQPNFVAPVKVARGLAIVTATNKKGKSTWVPVTIGPLATALFRADGTRHGGAAANVTAPDSSPTLLPASVCLRFGCPLKDIFLPYGVPFYVIPNGTGVRGRRGLDGVSLTLADVPAQVTYIGTQGCYASLDQLDALLPACWLAREPWK